MEEVCSVEVEEECNTVEGPMCTVTMEARGCISNSFTLYYRKSIFQEECKNVTDTHCVTMVDIINTEQCEVEWEEHCGHTPETQCVTVLETECTETIIEDCEEYHEEICTQATEVTEQHTIEYPQPTIQIQPAISLNHVASGKAGFRILILSPLKTFFQLNMFEYSKS